MAGLRGNFWEMLEREGWHIGYRHNPEHFQSFWLEDLSKDRVAVKGKPRRKSHKASRVVAVLRRKRVPR